MSKTYNVLFLCTGNSARSIIGEVVLNRFGKGRFHAFSAGSHPQGQVNPFAIELLQSNHFSTEGLRSKSWDEFSGPDAPQMDFVFTVCDQAAKEACPYWPGQPMTAHWGIPDPAAVEGSDETRRRAFKNALMVLSRRIELFTALPLDKLDRMAIQKHIRQIGSE
ncbi:MAG TPA: arsenate reductase ArsC [Gammaproteobacteria bacterium]|nr:arsenate reductase ArsC [Gammaproteobacteria bacterium]